MKILKCSLCLILSVLFFTSCNSIQTNENSYDCCVEIIRCLEENDVAGLKKLFCPKILSGYSGLDDEINEAMNFFEGQVISHDNFQHPCSSQKEKGKWVRYEYSPYMNNIKTDKNKTYNIKFYLITIWENDVDRVGISEINITDENGEKCFIGDYYYANPEYSN